VLATVVIVASAVPTLASDVRFGLLCSDAYREGYRYACLPGEYVDFYSAAEWSGERLPADAVVLSRKPSLFYVASGLPGTYYPLSEEPDVLFELAAGKGARYLLFDRLDGIANAYLAPILLRRPAAFCVLITAGPSGTALFGILPEAMTVADTPLEELPEGGPQFAGCDETFLPPH
jgi:hypothetical protein